MGTGTPTVTVSGLSAANAILKKLGLSQYTYDPAMPNYVRMVEKPYPREKLFEGYPEDIRALMEQAWRCQLCEDPACSHTCDIPGIMRRISVGNLYGAAKLAQRFMEQNNQDNRAGETWETMEKNCVLCSKNQEPVAISHIIQSIFK
jgi:prolycopene isomerase